MSRERLQKELDFYQLPFIEELGVKLDQSGRAVSVAESPLVNLFYEVLDEIKTCRLSDLDCFRAFIYYRQVGYRAEGARRVFIVPPTKYKTKECVIDRGHERFNETIHMGSGLTTVTKCTGGRVITNPSAGEKFRIIEINNEAMLRIINEEAAKFGLIFSYGFLSFGPIGLRYDIGFLKIAYS